MDGPMRHEPLRLNELFPEAQFMGPRNLPVVRCHSEARTCRPGDIFFCMSDGENAARQAQIAASKGAAAIVTSVPANAVLATQCILPDVPAAFAKACHAVAGNPSEFLRVIGVWGQRGSTSLCQLISAVLAAGNYLCGSFDQLGSFDGNIWRPGLPPVTSPATYAAFLRNARAQGCTHAVLELSPDTLAQQAALGLTLDVACYLGLTDSDQDCETDDFSSDAALGSGDFAALAKQLSAEGVTVLNRDRGLPPQILDTLDGPALTTGFTTPAEISGAVLERHPGEQTFLLCVGHESVPVRTKLVGQAHLDACLAAAAVGFAYGLPLTTIAKGLESVTNVPGQMERVDQGHHFAVYADVANAPADLESTLAELREITPGRILCVTGSAGGTPKNERVSLGRVLERGCDLCFLTADNPRQEDLLSTIKGVLAGLFNPLAAQVVMDRADAITAALEQAQDGDCVLIAGHGHRATQQIGHVRMALDDRQVAYEWLETRGYVDRPVVPPRRRAA